ncbi:MAG TPA: sigma-70 family RNA polymerase sigma factor, partial [Clostridia bacterium]|nr:sigma-70 family RNA polymerase sigma factor [Clostridia bacterium]
MPDEEVVLLAQDKDGAAVEYLLNKYKSMVRLKAKAFYISGAESDDLIQEGMIGLYKAIRDYNENKKVQFSAFAALCIKRQIITALKAATRLKHIPLNSYISLNKSIYEEDCERTLMD